MDTFLGEERQDQDMGTGGGEEGTLHILRLNQGHCLLLASPDPWPRPSPQPRCLLCWFPQLSTCLGQERNEDVGNSGTFLPPTPFSGRTVHSPALKSQTESGDQEARTSSGTTVPQAPLLLPQGPSHEIAALGSILVYLTLIPVPISIPPVWPSCQLSRSLQSPA